MSFALTLRLSAEGAAAVAAAAWQLARPDYPPHVTLAVLPDEDVAASVLAAAATLAARWPPLPLVLASIGVFPTPRPVLFLAPVVTGSLLGRHAAAMALLPEQAVHPHYRRGSWVPHVTLADSIADPVAGLASLGPLPLPLATELDRLEVVLFPPVRILASHALLRGAEAMPG